MKRVLFYFLLSLAWFQASAYIITPDQAEQTATDLVSDLDGIGSVSNTTLLYTINSTSDVQRPILYVYNVHTRAWLLGRFVIVSGESAAGSVLAYGDRLLDRNDIPDGLQFLIDFYQQQIEHLLEEGGGSGNAPSIRANGSQQVTSIVKPLLKTQWGQSKPYYNMCPVISPYTDPCVTGCGATAMAQVMKKWKYPSAVNGIPGYKFGTDSIEVEALSATTFEWRDSILLDVYKNRFTTNEQKNAVATLMRYAGQAQKMTYGHGASGSNLDRITKALNTFGYNAQQCALYTYWGNMENTIIIDSDDLWGQLMRNELDNDRPVIFSGYSTSTGNTLGHIFVVDGYGALDGNYMYHINLGWEGSGDTYCLLGDFTGAGQTFNTQQGIVIGIDTIPEMNVNMNAMDFTGYVDIPTTQHLTLTANEAFRFLGQDVVISVNGEDADDFTVSPDMLSADEVADSATVAVIYQPHHEGSSSAWLAITSNALEQEITVPLSGLATIPQGELFVDTTALSFIEFTGYSQEQTFTVLGDQLKHNVELSIDSNVDGMFTLSPTVITPEQAREGMTVTVNYTPTMSSGETSAVVKIQSGTIQDTVELTGTAIDAETIIQISQDTLAFDDGHTTYAQTQEFLVTGAICFYLEENGEMYTEPLREPVTLSMSKQGADRPFEMSTTTITPSQAFEGCPVTVTYLPTSEGEASARITLSTPHNSYEDLVVNLHGTASSEPCIRASSTSVAFNNWHTGYEASKTIIVSAYHIDGDMELNLDNQSGPFSVSRTSIPADSAAIGVPVTIYYEPAVDGPDSALVTLTNPGANPVTINLSGDSNSDPCIEPDVNSLHFEEYVGYTQTKRVAVKGYNLTKDVSVTMIVMNNGGTLPGDIDFDRSYSFSPNNISADEAEEGATVTVYYHPQSAGESHAELQMRCLDAPLDLETDPFIHIPITGYANESLCFISVTPRSLTFNADSTEAVVSKSLSITVNYSPDGSGDGPVRSTGDEGEPDVRPPFLQHFIAARIDGDTCFKLDSTDFHYLLGNSQYLFSNYVMGRTKTVTVYFDPKKAEQTVSNATITFSVDNRAKPITVRLTGIMDNLFSNVLQGDANGDGKVTIADVTELISYLMGGNNGVIDMEAADINHDGRITIADVTALIHFLMTGNFP